MKKIPVPISRRRFVKGSLFAAAPTSLMLPALAGAPPPEGGASHRALSVVCVGGHPDDPESGCAGTLSRYSALGHRVTVIYLTRGERGINGKSLEEAARIRSAECQAACEIMGTKAVFAGQIDGATEVTPTRIAQLQELVAAEAPDLLLTHWPTDTHLDHQAASLLTLRCYLGLPRRPQLYWFEVNTGSQSLGFMPNTYVDVTPVLDKKKAALLAHRSQGGEEIWRTHHEIIAQFRGREAGVKAAEAFVQLVRPTATWPLPGL